MGEWLNIETHLRHIHKIHISVLDNEDNFITIREACFELQSICIQCKVWLVSDYSHEQQDTTLG